MKTLEEQIEWIDSECAATRRKFERWLRQKRIEPNEADRIIECICQISETLHALHHIKEIIEAETGEESEMELQERGDTISNVLIQICQLKKKTEDTSA